MTAHKQGALPGGAQIFLAETTGLQTGRLGRLRDRHWNPASVASFRRRRPDPYERNAAISWHFERDPIPYALETDWPVEAGGFEPLHFRIGIREDSQPGAAGFELTHLN
jgi:hypothetical protein